jgi:1-phosphatidylinositol-4-phosphate 5-kinase
MNDLKHGYGIYRWADGGVYYGEWKENMKDGQGYKRWADGDEYCGEYMN